MSDGPRVWMVNWQPQHELGVRDIENIVRLSQGRVNAFRTSELANDFSRQLADSDPEDFILLSGFLPLNVIVTSIMLNMHGRINLMIFDARERAYVKRTILTTELGGSLA